ncbi:MAG: hypothetical protein ACE5GW_05915 [Planctomycetota bacterium]
MGSDSGAQEDEIAAGVAISKTAALSHRTLRKWEIQLPAERFTPVGSGFHFTETLGRDFTAAVEGTALAIDSDGDGKLDVRAEGKDALITLRGRSGSGVERPYAVRLVNREGWRFAASGVMSGRLHGTRFRLIDQNNNGSYVDYGEDAMIVGRGNIACFLSRVVNVRGKLLDISVARDGSTIRATSHRGESGTLTLGPCKTKGKVLAAIIRSEDGRCSFNVARTSRGLRVPVGSYLLHGGEIGLGENRVKFRAGRSKAITVGAGEKKEVRWGGPVSAEFAYKREGDELHLSPKQVWYFGQAGEEYYHWFPIGKSPKFTIANLMTGREIAQAYFPGSC